MSRKASARSISPKNKILSTLSTSPVHSRSTSRSGSRTGRGTLALSRGSSLEGSAITLKASRPNLVSASSEWSSRSSLRGKSKEISARDGESSEPGGRPASLSRTASARDLGISRPSTATVSKAARRASQTPGNRVSTIANHFNRLSRENERERQRKLALFRGKRARPVAVARSTVQVFDNVRDAAKEDSDDERSSDGADDEEDDEHDVDSEVEDRPKVRLPTGVSPKRPNRDVSIASSAETFTYDRAPTMASALVCPQFDSMPSIDIGPHDIEKPSTPPLPTSSDTAPPSVPPSPLLPDGFATMPRMSDAESSGTERGSLIKAITNLWAYRGGDFTPLEYPL